MFKKNVFTSFASFVTIVAITLGVSVVHIDLAYAAALNTLSDTQSSVKVSTVSDHTIQFVTPTGIPAGQTVTITFPAGYSMGSFAVNNVDFGTSTSASCSSFNQETLAASQSGTTWGIAQAGQVITLTSGSVSVPANRCVQFKIGSNATFGGTGVSQITNPASPASYAITIAGGFGDSGSITTNIITDDTVSMTGTVAQSLSFTISTSTIYFGTLGSGGAKYASSTNTAGDATSTVAHTLAVGTNAPSGYTITARGQTLTSQQNAANTITAIGSTVASSTAGTEQFGIRATAVGGTGYSLSSTFSAASSYGYDGTATTSTIFASGTGSTNTTTYSLYYVANIAPITEAGTYAANLVYVATANF